MDNATPCTPAADYRTNAIRRDGWTAQRQALFLVTLADSGLVSEACREVGMSPTSAYMFRRRAEGRGFALGWRAAMLFARDHLEDALNDVAFRGFDALTSKAEGVTRRRTFNKALSIAMLDRLERQAEALDNEEAAMAHSIGSAFEEYLDLIASGCTRKDVADFLALHPDPLAAERTAAEAPRAEAASALQTRKLVENFAVFADEADASDGAFVTSRNQRRLNRVKKRRLSTTR